MSTLLGEARIRLRPDTNGFESDAKSSITGSMKKVAGVAAAAFAAAGGIGLGKSIVSEASNLEQSMGGIDAVFKESSKQVKQWAKDAALSAGLSKNEFGEFATTLGSMLKNKGIEDYANQTNDLIKLGGDLAAQFGGSTADAVSAVSSLMRGEADPIERYGVTINETAINAKLAEQGLSGLTGAALEQAKTQARLQLLMEQTADAQGAFARESGTAANAQQKLSASWSNAKAALGEAFLPMLAELASKMTGVLPKVTEFFTGAASKAPALWSKVKDVLAGMSPTWSTLKSSFGDILKIIKDVGPALGAIFGGGILTLIQSFAPVIKSLTGYLADNEAVVWALVAAFTAWKIAAMAGPLGWIAALVSAVVVAYEKFGWFRDGVQTAWRWIQDATKAAWENVLKPIFGFIVKAWNGLVDGMAWAWANVLKPAWDAISSVLTALWNNVLMPIFGLIGSVFKTTLDAMAWAWVNVLWPVFTKVAEIAGWLWTNILSPIFDGIGKAWSGLMDGMKWVWDNVLSPVFTTFGEVVNGLKGIFDDVVTTIGTVWDGLKAIVAKPVKFVIDTVWNNGIVAAWNVINDLWGGTDNKGYHPAWLADYAQGGVLPGYTPGRDVHRFFSPTGGILNLSGGEAVMRPEFTRALGASEINHLNAIARSGGSSAVNEYLANRSFADGGIIPYPDWLRNVAPDWMDSWVDKVNSNPAVNIIGGLITKSAESAWSAIWGGLASLALAPIDAAVGALEGQDVYKYAPDETRKAGSLPLGSTWESIWKVVKAAIPEARANSTVRNEPGSYHHSGKAIDFGWGSLPGGNGNPGLASINQFLYDQYGSQLAELIYDGLGDNRPDLKNGRPYNYGAVVSGAHRNHVHAAVYDRGGVLQPGLTLARNDTGGPEAVLTAEQYARHGGPLVEHLEINVGQGTMHDALEKTLFELRRIRRGGLVYAAR